MTSLQKIVVQPTFVTVVSKTMETINKFPVNRVYCVGRNYAKHAQEMGHNPDREPPFFFTKPANSVVDCSVRNKIPYPPMTSNLHHEGELVVAIGKEGFQLSSKQEANSIIFGHCLGCDLTRRDLQSEAKQLSRPWDVAKGFDYSAPCGPIVPVDEMSISGSDQLQLLVEGDIRQNAPIGEMIWSISETIMHLSNLFRLLPGDLIFSGTPEGVGAIGVGDNVKIVCGTLPSCNFQIIEKE